MQPINESIFTNDLIFKKVFSSEENRHLLKKIIEMFMEREFEEIAPRETYSIDTYQREYDQEGEMRTKVDVLATDSTGETVIIEFQIYAHPFYIGKSFYYSFEAYQSLNLSEEVMGNVKKDEYSHLRKTCAINIINDGLAPREGQALRTFTWVDKTRGREETEDEFPMIYFSLTNKNLKEGSDMYHFQQLFRTGTVSQSAPDFMLEIQRKAAYHQLTKRERDIVNQLDNERERLNELLSISRDEGFDEGRLEGRREVAKKLLKMGYELEEIGKVTGISLSKLMLLEKKMQES